uniref:Uncharacterized protein n=1 Tax=Kalanchoe fedtschenkoi TaxID=63787 RepID=A0A7N0TK57_KALFE
MICAQFSNLLVGMSSTSTEFATSRRSMGIYDPLHQMNMWKDTYVRPQTNINTSEAILVPLSDNKMKGDYSPRESFENLRTNLETSKPPEKSQRRRAQNREAARKSRLRKKAYVQQLESSRLKLSQLEEELERARSQGAYIGSALDSSHVGLFATVNPGVAAFEMEYAHWVEEQHEQTLELRNALQAQTISDVKLKTLVDTSLIHYDNLFQKKGDAAKADVFYLMSGMWRTPAERFFLWIGGFRPSELLNVLMPQLEPLSEQQHQSISKLRQSSQQAEDALSQGIDRLKQTLSQSIAAPTVGEGCYLSQMICEIEKLDALENFVSQADHLRQKTLQHMSRILTTRQAARGLLALGEFFHRFRALSSLWAARALEPF